MQPVKATQVHVGFRQRKKMHRAVGIPDKLYSQAGEPRSPKAVCCAAGSPKSLTH